MAVIYLFPRQMGKRLLFIYENMLIALKKEENEMKNPLLEDWCKIRNEIRAFERKIRRMKNEKID